MQALYRLPAGISANAVRPYHCFATHYRVLGTRDFYRCCSRKSAFHPAIDAFFVCVHAHLFRCTFSATTWLFNASPQHVVGRMAARTQL